jgi:formamidopyrimidine-DNA glycosylase
MRGLHSRVQDGKSGNSFCSEALWRSGIHAQSRVGKTPMNWYTLDVAMAIALALAGAMLPNIFTVIAWVIK